jgi:hypothetical protein
MATITSGSTTHATPSVDLHDIECPGCGAPMDGHMSPSSSGLVANPTVVREYVRGTGPRKVATAHPECPHCKGRIHFNMGATAINAECLWRQYLVGVGKLAPKDKLPEMYLSNMLEMAEWYEAEIKLGQSFDYGKSGGGTYSTRRKTPATAVAGGPVTAPPPTAPGPIVPAPHPLPGSKPGGKAFTTEVKKEEAPAPPKEPTKDELRAKRRELLKARNQK